MRLLLLAASALALSAAAAAQPAAPAAAQPQAAAPDTARMFGEREDVQQISLSPGGTRIAFIAPGPGQSTRLYISDIGADAAPRLALTGEGKPDRLRSCRWVSDERLVCTVYMVSNSPDGVVDASRVVAIDIDGKNLKLLS